ncbi:MULTISPECIES: 2-succinylbenzoate--CoA ligase [Aphanizomenon]|uniref:2-succinylbenzoate--CoA ligase n=1 Tax=Aphanizomenon flos-aquae FACHB-1249 TaxID=2692889 RepID=A0ABR8IUC9_APHFL|nr:MULTISPECIES: 2-succinylbenzoate--CoA ligase [Aphanizomenon]MBD2392343.1 2-succinylbenzoate--CoA ligase [Aphanizomenon flos-aquae FACHB-1171]MBD2558052.1 2-succinylbenzoate--CoA ligase [Aphanizomenon flos-aquae FACHB-1290]MBD2632810.1 2-succinylbenzoate--CoA ligase [Aphanizomenon sp. FACHB-1399]MBD2644360.1 2-succinylbenzoate--CoA ligase [Aphanizomenon sp. FACHB-1401]MBD2658409.1 2-succinylbenzoate--CoA ligase [Aphanizomenon flos-aquae FACHB-1265]
MENLLEDIQNHDWLICDHSQELLQIATELYLQLMQLSNPKIIIAERSPVRFLGSFIAACAAKCPVFLCNPDWGKDEWEQVFNLVQPDIVLGINHNFSKSPIINHELPITNSIMIPTGGSSGKIKFAIHTWQTLTASVKGFTEYFSIDSVNSFCILPLYHVSGLMQFMRSLTTGGKLVISTSKKLENCQIPNIKTEEFFISLVPTQLQKLLQNIELTQWLSKFSTVLLGGAPPWEELLEKARFHQIRLAPTYGMTETASQIATLKPDEFLKGKFNSGKILPHAKIIIDNQPGNINIQSQSLALGYYPQIWENRNNFLVDDIGFLDNQDYLHIIGRNSDKIITGGENVYPTEIESAIRKTQMVIDVCVIGIADKHWGQALTAIYTPKNKNISHIEIQNQLKNQLSKFKIPKYWISLANLPRNVQGKINRQQLQKIAKDILKT